MKLLTILYLIVILFFYIEIIDGTVFSALSFAILLSSIFQDFYKNRRFSLFMIWQVGFIYMILSEIIILSYEEILNGQDIKAMSFLSIGNFMFIVGYLFPQSRRKMEMKEYILKSRKHLIAVIAILYVIFIYFRTMDVVRLFFSGRDQGDSLGSGSAFGEFLLAAGYILPSLIGFYAIRYFPQKKWRSLFFVIPLFVIGTLMGARYKLLFMLIPYFVVMDVFSVRRVTKKKLILIAVLGVFLVSLSTIVKFTRTKGFADADISSINNNKQESDPLLYKLALEMSPENIIKMTKYGNRYFDDEGNSYLYGLNSSFVLYIWIPRSIWKDKPTPLDYWMIRKYENVSDAASTASGFIGDFRADFGYFSLLIILLIGTQLKRLDNFLYHLSFTSDNNLQKVLVGFCFAWVFFFVRSPLTSTTSFIIAILFLYILLKTCTKKYEVLN